ncbi:protein SODIUM POTASSIUM ROOT DEFECTIVE 1-like [Momordica charantia]|uniref:Protein SODIUM POTASSIUM ROOT DEFECTIVE 1-like n=1 Tax=Momordica charantia TaxID=3673 RepID=A0A6J1DJK2_MOMCH|nr:protein SODIUM POTASSIUM ROOT DEFECTIVE 1-like [Momordica charantia]
MKKKLGGFTCHSPTATAVCISANPRSAVVVPRRLARADVNANGVDRVRFASNGVNYLRLVASPSLSIRSEGRLPAVKQPVSTLSSSPENVFQVVVLRVALHCQGCASKVKRHLTKMEGVTSFSIDLEAKRVTVMGRISPHGVLESISKVKRAELWPMC